VARRNPIKQLKQMAKKRLINLIPARSKVSEPSLGMVNLRRWEEREEDEGEGMGKSPKGAVVTSGRAKKKKPEGRTGIIYRVSIKKKEKKNP